jgi:hemerythrin-like metal-binding protein
MINDLHEAMRQGRGKEVIGRLLDALVDYTGYHFNVEEKAFDTHGYPHAVTHKRAHAELMRTAAELQIRPVIRFGNT